MKLILGSSSKFRRMVMDEFGVPYEVVSPDIDEKAIRSTDPDELVLAIANAKADAVAAHISEPALIIASDQVVVWNGEIREKPISLEQAKDFLRSYSEHPAIMLNCLVVLNSETGKRVQSVEAMHVWYLPIPEDVIELLADHEHTFLSAGALRFENPLMKKYMIHTDGSLDHALGLPKKILQKLLKEQGYELN